MCNTTGCNNEPELYDLMHNEVCEECMEREVEQEGADREDFTSIN